MNGWQRTSLRVVGWGLCVAGLALVVHRASVQWPHVAALRLSFVSVTALVASVALSLAAHTTTGCAWRFVLKALGSTVPAAEAVGRTLKLQIAKYIPGNVAQYALRVGEAVRTGVPFAQATLSIFVEVVAMASTALCV